MMRLSTKQKRALGVTLADSDLGHGWHYVTCVRDDGAVAYVSGPYSSHSEAEAALCQSRSIVSDTIEPRAWFAAWGTAQFTKGFLIGAVIAIVGMCLGMLLTGCAQYTAPFVEAPCTDTEFFGIKHNTCDATPERLPDERIECARVDLGGVYASYLYTRTAGVMSTTIAILPGVIPSIYDGQDWYRRWVEPNTVQCLGFDRGECVGDIDVFISHDCGDACTAPAADAHSTLSVHATLDDRDLPTFTLYDSEKLWAWPVTMAAITDCEGTS